jgi:hypothetical protein
MPQQQKKAFTTGDPIGAGARDEAGPQAVANLPFAWWSNMADMQKEFLSSMVKKGVETAETIEEDNVTEIRRTTEQQPISAVGQKWMMTMAEEQRELTSFVSDRLAKDQAFLTKAIGVSSLQQLIQLQVGWLTQATQDYSAELGRLADIMKSGATRNS